MKTIGYLLFALMYHVYCLFPVNRRKVLCIKTHDDGPGSNVSIVERELRKKGDYQFAYITKSETREVRSHHKLFGLLRFFFVKPYEVATSGVILLDNIFLPMAYIKRRKKVKVIQLWHGTGTIKKFGQDATTGKLHELEYRSNQWITHLIVNSDAMISLYAGAFGVDLEKVYPIGLPKTDEMIRMSKSEEEILLTKKLVYTSRNIDPTKKLILYAPTFRDDEVTNPQQIKYIEELVKKLPDAYALGVRLHPHVAKAYQDRMPEKLVNLSDYPDITELLLASDILITDYSSIIFEYCLLRRKMIFYAYDLEKFEQKGRGFYETYGRYVPGHIVNNTEELLEEILDETIDIELIEEFILKHYNHMDMQAVHRLCELIERP